MKRRLLILSSAVVLALGTVGLFLFAASLVAPAFAGSRSSGQDFAVQQPETIVARRMISIPFGIDSSLNLMGDGRIVQVSGHGNCGDSGQSFKLRVNVTQGSTHARASGSIQSDCNPDTDFHWNTNAFAVPAFEFQPGPADACGMVIVYSPSSGARVGKWCKQVDLN